ncbi:MAG: stage II sporulation protein M [Clostridia bacterium]|nr:stage II sporulation protein M [Clostridia bacterium]
MKFSGVITSEANKRNTFFKDKIQLISFAVIAVSLIIGSAFYLLSEEYFNAEIKKLFSESLSFMTTGSAFEIFSGIMVLHAVYFIIMTVFGTSSLGYVFILLMTFFKTLSIGLINAFLYSNYGLKGIEYCCLVFFPGKYLILLVMLMLTYFCIKNSMHVKECMRGEYNKERKDNTYPIRLFVIGILLSVSIAVECFLVRNFSQLFSF